MSTTDENILSRLNRAKAPREKKAPAEKGKATGKGSPSLGLERWFQERRKEMAGKCMHCGRRSCKNDDMYYKHSIAHLLPKNIFDSIKTHPLNWIELCFWDKSCHTNFDNHTLDIIDLNCFDTVIERFVAMYPDIDLKERKHIPDVLRQYVKIDVDVVNKNDFIDKDLIRFPKSPGI